MDEKLSYIKSLGMDDETITKEEFEKKKKDLLNV